VAQATLPTGHEFQVNSYTTFAQEAASVAADADGDFVVVWQSTGSSAGDTSFQSIQGQRYSSAGSAVGSEFQVNTYTTSVQVVPSVAADADGDFVVVWISSGSAHGDSSGFSIQGQRYNSAGGAVGSEFQVNTYTTGDQQLPSVAVDADGDFVVVWSSFGSSGSDTSMDGVQGQRYNSAGTAVGSEFQVNTYTTNSQRSPWVAVEASGDFVVVWDSLGSSSGDASSRSIQGRRYDSAGNEIGSQFQVNTYTTNDQEVPSVAVDADGDFVVAWSSTGSFGDASSYSVQGQSYNSAGSAVGSQFQVNTYTTNIQWMPSVAAEADGDFVVAWGSSGSFGGDTSSSSVQGQRYNSSGSAVGSEFQVNTYITGLQDGPSVAVDADGDFVVAWESEGSSGSDTSGFSIQGLCSKTIDLTSGTSGSLVPSSSFNQTRGIDVTVGPVPGGAYVQAMTLDGLSVSSGSATVGARIYDSEATGLIASAQTTVSTGTNLSVTVPISAVLSANNDYRLAFFVSAGGGATATLFDPDPSGSGGFSYTEEDGILEINQAYSIATDAFPTSADDLAPRIRVDVSCSPRAIPLPALGYRGLALLAALLVLAPLAWRGRRFAS
jgi:hypothetical protein